MFFFPELVEGRNFGRILLVVFVWPELLILFAGPFPDESRRACRIEGFGGIGTRLREVDVGCGIGFIINVITGAGVGCVMVCVDASLFSGWFWVVRMSSFQLLIAVLKSRFAVSSRCFKWNLQYVSKLLASKKFWRFSISVLYSLTRSWRCSQYVAKFTCGTPTISWML